MDAKLRRRELELVPAREKRIACAEVAAKPIRIERNVWIGFESCILPGVTLGEGSIVGARSVVTESVPPFTIVGGNPARVIRSFSPSERQTHGT
jgi:acetyltransferase-like isoleucine patch superfamily enzyme